MITLKKNKYGNNSRILFTDFLLFFNIFNMVGSEYSLDSNYKSLKISVGAIIKNP